MRSQLNAAFGARKLQLLRIRIRNNKIHPRQIQRDHVIHRVRTAAADPDYGDARREIRVGCFLNRQVQGHGLISLGNSGRERFDFMSNRFFAGGLTRVLSKS